LGVAIDWIESRVTVAERLRRFNRAGRTILAGLALAGCVQLPMDAVPATPEPLPAGRRAVFALDPAARPTGHRKVVLEEDADSVLSRVDLFRAPGAEPIATFELHEPRLVPPPWPAVVVSPILKGGYVLERWVAGVLVGEGIAVAIPLQSEEPLPKETSPEDLAAAFLESVRGTRAVVTWLAASERMDPARLGSVGTSLGALRNVVLLADEPRLRANLLALGGLDVAWIFDHSKEASVVRYRRERAAIEGIEAEALSRRLADAFWFHDTATARAVDGRTVLLVLARFDRAIPLESGMALREALGRPETRVIPASHYGSLLALPWIRVWMVQFFRERFGIDRARTAKGEARAAAH
jgi:dienelactone hydrolase